MGNLKLFLFDLDGTILTTGGAGLKALDKAFFELFEVENAVQSVSPSGKTDPAIFREMIRHLFMRELRPNEKELIAETYLNHLQKEIESSSAVRLLPGVETFIRQIQNLNDIVFGLGTGNLEKGAYTKLSPTPLKNTFQFGGFGSDSEIRAELLKTGHARAKEKYGAEFEPHSVYIIGDTLLDILAAHQAGFKAVAVATGNKSYDELKTGKPDILINDITEFKLDLLP